MTAAEYFIPLLLAAAGGLLLFSKKDLFSGYMSGAKEGLETAAGLVPTLVLLISSISMLRASGALDIISGFLAPAFGFAGIPEEVIGFILMRPVSGSGSAAMLNDLFSAHGADSQAGNIASVIMGSSDTVFYVFAVYFGAAGIKKTRAAVPSALAAQLFCAVAACIAVRLFL